MGNDVGISSSLLILNIMMRPAQCLEGIRLGRRMDYAHIDILYLVKQTSNQILT